MKTCDMLSTSIQVEGLLADDSRPITTPTQQSTDVISRRVYERFIVAFGGAIGRIVIDNQP